MSKNKNLYYLIFILAIVLRLVLCLSNREANDDHMEVIALIADTRAIPDPSECAECFQPKFFYVFNASVLILLNIDEPVARIITIQLVNLIFSFFILLLTWKFLNQKSFSESVKLITFAIVALNPCLAGINVQVTNDTMIILLGVLSIYCIDNFFRHHSPRDGLLLILFTVLSGVVKGSGLVIIIGAICIFSAYILLSETRVRKIYLRFGLILIFASIAIVPFAGGYYFNYIESGTPFATGIGEKSNIESTEEFLWRPGIQSVRGGYLTFHLGGMIKQPYITNDPYTFPIHRTSVWSQLYGRTFFLHFDQHPPTWKNTSQTILSVGRIALILGLVPLLLFVAGLFNSIKEFALDYKFNIKKYFLYSDWQHLVFIAGFLGFIVFYTRDYPDFSTMKSVFLFPGLLAFTFAFAKGYSMVRSLVFQKILMTLLIALVVVHVFDIGLLAWQLL